MTGFENLDVVVTGGVGALGAAIVSHLLDRGAVVHVPFIQPSLPPVPWADHPSVRTTAGVDLTREQDTIDYFAALPTLWASVHAAGGFSMSPIAETSLADLREQLDINLTTAFLSCRESIAAIRRTGGGGRVVNVGARVALAPVGGMSAYSVAKAGVVALTEALAAELLSEGILVNAVLPSMIDTPSNRVAMPEADHASWPRPEDIASAIGFLISPENRLTHGALLPVYGAV